MNKPTNSWIRICSGQNRFLCKGFFVTIKIKSYVAKNFAFFQDLYSPKRWFYNQIQLRVQSALKDLTESENLSFWSSLDLLLSFKTLFSLNYCDPFYIRLNLKQNFVGSVFHIFNCTLCLSNISRKHPI